MGTLSVDKLVKTSTGAAEFTLPATDGTAGTVLQTDGSGQLSVATVGSSGIATDAVTATQIAADAVGSSEIAANAVTTTEIVDDAVTIAKLAATGTASATTFLRGDNSWATPIDTGKIKQVTSASITTEVRTTSTSFVASGMIATLPNAIQAGSLVAMWLSGGTMLTGSWTAKTYTTFYYSFAGGAYTVTSSDPLEYIVWAGTSGTVEGIPHSMNYLLNPGGAGTVSIQPYFKASSGDNQYFNEAGYRATMIVMEIGA